MISLRTYRPEGSPCVAVAVFIGISRASRMGLAREVPRKDLPLQGVQQMTTRQSFATDVIPNDDSHLLQ